MSVMLFDLANDQAGHVAGAQGELESRLGPVLGEGAGPRARVRGWQEGLWTQVGCSSSFILYICVDKILYFLYSLLRSVLGIFSPLLVDLFSHTPCCQVVRTPNLNQILNISKSFANFLPTLHNGRWRRSCSRTPRPRSSPISSTCSTQVGNFNFDSILFNQYKVEKYFLFW